MNKDYALVNGKKLRYGFTTGSAATAAAKSAAEFLINGNYSENVEIILPNNNKLLIETNVSKLPSEMLTSNSISTATEISRVSMESNSNPLPTNG